jgi:hypothetical protein
MEEAAAVDYCAPPLEDVELFLTAGNTASKAKKKTRPHKKHSTVPTKVRPVKNESTTKQQDARSWNYSTREIKRETDVTGATKPLWTTFPKSTPISSSPAPSNQNLRSSRTELAGDLDDLANSFQVSPTNGRFSEPAVGGSANASKLRLFKSMDAGSETNHHIPPSSHCACTQSRLC